MSRRVVSAAERLAEKARLERRARRRRTLVQLGWGVVVLAPLVLVGWLLLASPWLVVQKVVVSGQDRLTAAEVLAAADVRLGEPLARVDTGGLARRVRSLGPVLDVQVHRAWPNTLEVKVVEREPVAAIGRAPSFTLLDRTGAHLGSAPKLPAGVVLLSVARPGPGDRVTVAALRVLEGVPQTVRAMLVQVRATTTEDVTLQLRDGRTVVWGGTAQAREKGAVVVPLLRLPGKIYDVSTPSVVTRR